MFNKFIQIIKIIYTYYIQAILFIAGFVVLNIAVYKLNTTAGLFFQALLLFYLVWLSIMISKKRGDINGPFKPSFTKI